MKRSRFFGWVLVLTLLVTLSGAADALVSNSSGNESSRFRGLFDSAGGTEGTDHYVRDGATGANDGTDWANAWTTLPATLTRGDTYYIADGSYSSYTFDDEESGSLYITIKKATESAHGTGSGWDHSYGDGQAVFANIAFGAGYYVFDGVTGGGPGQWETGFGFKIKSGGYNVQFVGAVSNISVSHVDMENNGRYTQNSNEDSIYGIGGMSNITISHCYVHDVCTCQLLTRDANGVILEYSKLARNGPSGFDGIHREAWSASTDDNITIRYNIFEDISNTGFIALVNGWGDAENWEIYGNVFLHTGEFADARVSRVIGTRYDPDPNPIHRVRAVNWDIHNNLVVDIQGTSVFSFDDEDGSYFNVNAYNNMWFNNTGNAVGITEGTHNYNWFYNNYRIEGCDPPCNLDAEAAARESHGVVGTGNPLIDRQNGDYRLNGPIPGLALYPPFDRDALGNLRGQDGVWDRGAYEFVPQLELQGASADQSIHLSWAVNVTLPVTTTWHIDYYTQTSNVYSATDPFSATRAYTLTENVQNYRWYTVTLNAMLASTPLLTDTVRVMPTDIAIYLPLVWRTR